MFLNSIACMQLENLQAVVGAIWSEDRSLQLQATAHFRKLLSIGCVRLEPVFFYCFL